MVACFAQSEGMVTEVASNYDYIHCISHAIHVISLQFQPIGSSLFGHIDGIRVFEHHSLFVSF